MKFFFGYLKNLHCYSFIVTDIQNNYFGYPKYISKVNVYFGYPKMYKFL